MLAIVATVFFGFIYARSTDDVAYLRRAAEVVQSELRYLQSRAIREGILYKAEFDIVGNSIRFRYSENLRTGNLNSTLFETLYLAPLGVSLDTSTFPHNLRYNPRGTATPAGALVLRRGNTRIQLTSALGSGRIRINEINKVVTDEDYY